ncbi:hypothetical protein N7488_004749 [Penicillium malachiteum]|nr:hypothetical protein N7488_004749 [Penicillium malachiteum]
MEPTNGDPLLEILQTAVAIGDLRSSINAIESGHANPVAYQVLLQKGYEIQAKLMELYQDGRLGKEPHRSSAQLSNEMENLAPESLFGFAYEFSSPNHAFLFVMFWTHLVLLQPLILRLNSLLRPQTGSMTAIESSSPFGDLSFINPEKYADKVARSMCYCLQGCMRASFTKLAAFTLCMISLYYVDIADLEKHDWCLEAIRSIARRGYDVSVHLSKLMAAQWTIRWVVGYPDTCISLRGADISVCDVD